MLNPQLLNLRERAKYIYRFPTTSSAILQVTIVHWLFFFIPETLCDCARPQAFYIHYIKTSQSRRQTPRQQNPDSTTTQKCLTKVSCDVKHET